MQPEGIDIDAGAATPLVSPGPLRGSGCRLARRRCRGDSRRGGRAAFAKFVLDRHSADGARDQVAAAGKAHLQAHPAPAADLIATIPEDELYALLGGDDDDADDNGPAGPPVRLVRR